MLTTHKSLGPQAQRALRLLIERGSLTQMEGLHAGAGMRLAARVKEIREAFGHGVIRTETESNGNSRWARYVWVGSDGEQLRLGA